MNAWQPLLEADTRAFLWLNNLGVPSLDGIMNAVSGNLLWAPLYAVLIYLLSRRYGWKGTLWLLLGIVLLITLTDQGSVHLFKDVFQRLRPCHEPDLQGLFRLAKASGCGGSYGFVSSHAANTAGLAVFVGCLLQSRRALGLLLAWSVLISFSRIYLGVHYPLDVIMGMVFGTMVGYAVFRVADDWLLVLIQKRR